MPVTANLCDGRLRIHLCVRESMCMCVPLKVRPVLTRHTWSSFIIEAIFHINLVALCCVLGDVQQQQDSTQLCIMHGSSLSFQSKDEVFIVIPLTSLKAVEPPTLILIAFIFCSSNNNNTRNCFIFFGIAVDQEPIPETLDTRQKYIWDEISVQH